MQTFIRPWNTWKIEVPKHVNKYVHLHVPIYIYQFVSNHHMWNICVYASTHLL